MTLSIPRFSRRSLKPYFAEFLGTSLLIVLGDGVVAQCLLSDYTYGTWLSINIAWAAAVCLSSYLSDPSPAINPAVTICMAIIRPSAGQWRTIPGKLFAQFLGGFVGAAIVYLNYRSAIHAWDPELTVPGGSILSPKGHHSAGIFSTYPSAFFSSNWEAALQELLGSAVLMFGVLSISDPVNAQRYPAPQLSMFLLLLAIGAALGWQTGYVRYRKIIHGAPDINTDCARPSTQQETLVRDSFLPLFMEGKFSLQPTTTVSFLSLCRLQGVYWARRLTTLCFTRAETRLLLILSTRWRTGREHFGWTECSSKTAACWEVSPWEIDKHKFVDSND